MKAKRTVFSKMTAWLVLFATIAALFPVHVSAPEEAKAEMVSAGTTYIEGIGQVTVLYESVTGYKYCLDANQDLIVTGEYYTNTSATKSYHTVRLYFTEGDTDGQPTRGRYFSVDVENHTTGPSDRPNYVSDTYRVPHQKLAEMLYYLFGEEGLKGPQRVYMSEGFKLKSRHSSTSRWSIQPAPIYNTLTGIQEAGEGRWSWSDDTYNNFANYFDVEITLDLGDMELEEDPGFGSRRKYKLEVEEEGNGIVSGSLGEFYAGTPVYEIASPDNGWYLKEWRGNKVGIDGVDWDEETIRFPMPARDVKLTAVFAEITGTPPPVTPEIVPVTPIATPTATPTPTPSPTPEPTSQPNIELTREVNRHRYYTTDKGYTVAQMVQAPVLYNRNGTNGVNNLLKKNNTYSVGKDTAGNEWYFYPNGNSATYVHPKKYKGFEVDDVSVKYIQELTFPEKLKSGATTYTVISIGGGLDWYGEESYANADNSIVRTLTKTTGAYSYYKVQSNTSVLQSWESEELYYRFGVIGNGTLYSSSGPYTYYGTTGVERSQKYESSYTVYNTTLAEITIPKSVTRIEDYAFANCNALVEINGGEGIRKIGQHAFEGGSMELMLSTPEDNTGSCCYYIYNDSYATELPYTTVMTEYDTTRRLSAYMALAEFPRLEIIEENAFLNRSNLFAVTMPESLLIIEADAFKGCRLDTIEIPSLTTVIEGERDTLGTKGYRPEDHKTQIVTEPDSEAMYYGLLYLPYYKLRCGYDVTYDNNFDPEETFVTRAELSEHMVEEKKTVKALKISSDVFDAKDFGSVTLDPDGNVWYRKEGNVIPQLLDFGSKVVDIQLVAGTNQYTHPSSATGGLSGFTESAASAYVYTEMGEVYRFYSCTTDSSDRETPYKSKWKKVPLPEGASNLLWSSIGEDASVTQISGGGQYTTASTTKSTSSDTYLFYLTKEGTVEYILQGASGMTLSITTSGAGGGGSYPGDPATGGLAKYNTTPQAVKMPSGVSFVSFSLEAAKRGNRTVAYGTSQESRFFPTIYGIDTEGGYWVGMASAFNNGVDSTATVSGADYVWTRSLPGVNSNMKQVWSGGSYGGQTGDFAITEDGDLIRIIRTQTSDESTFPPVYAYSTATVAAGNFAERVSISGQTFLVDEEGYLWFFANQPDLLPVKLFSDANIEKVYCRTGDNSLGTSTDTQIKYETELYIFDDNNRVWQISYHIIKIQGNVVTPTTYIGTLTASRKLVTLPAKVKSVSYKVVPDSTPYGWSGHAELSSMLILLEDGSIYAYGAANHSIQESGPAGGYAPGYYYINGGNGKVSPEGVFFISVAHMRDYSLALDAEGNVYRTGYHQDRNGVCDPDYLPDFTLIPDLEMEYIGDGSFLAGYHFIEELYDNMFEREGYTFLNWNLAEDNSDTPLYPSEELVIEGPTRIYANWEKTVNKVRYHPNGGSGHMADSVCDPLVTKKVVLSECLFTKDGYVFVGWNTKKNGSGTMYQPGQEFLTRASSTTLYAQWEMIDYTLHVAEDEVRVRPVVSTSHELSYNEEFTIPDALADREYEVSYELRADAYRVPGMSTTPRWKTPGIRTGERLPDNYTKAYLDFIGWELWEEIEQNTEYNYLNRIYLPGQKDKNFARHKQYDPFLFPFWGGEASYVDLPVAECDGYWFLGWSENVAETDETAILHAEEGSGAMYKPKGNETLYAFYTPKEYDIALVAEAEGAQPGDILQEQTVVTMTFDREIPDVLAPVSERYGFMGYYDVLDENGIPIDRVSKQYYDETGAAVIDEETGEPLVWRIHDGSVTKLYAYFISEVEVILDGRGATRQEQTSVIMTYEEVGPDVIPPEKTGYEFGGYFTEIRGAGKQYFDAEGKGTAVWLERNVYILYAYWIQDPVDLPERDDPDDPEVLPEDRIEIEAALEGATIQLYADDNNPETGALTDVQPYLVADVVVDGEVVAEGAIPSTENLAIRAKMGAWMLSSVLERRSGVDNVRVHVTVPYQTQYEDEETEELIISDVRTRTFDFLVPKAWSYWEVTEGGMYFPEKVVVENAALENGKAEVPVDWDCAGATEKPDYRITVYGGKEEHVKWNPEGAGSLAYDSDGMPQLSIELSSVEYIVSTIPGRMPDITEHLSNVCFNAALRDTTQFTVKSDCVSVDGITLLSDAPGNTGNGEVPMLYELERIRQRIIETEYSQTYKCGLPLAVTAKNLRYDTEAGIIYHASEGNVGDMTEHYVDVEEVNEIKVHTPVVCIPVVEAGHEDMYQCAQVPEEHTVLVLDEEGIHSEFVLQIENAGYHSEKKGYGEKDYALYLAEKDGKKQNEVCFPFAVWMDVGNDKEMENDISLEADTWYVLGNEEQRFYVPVETKEGSYEIKFRSVAVNGTEETDKSEAGRNAQPEHYVAEGKLNVYLTGRLYDFTVYEVGGNAAWEETEESSYLYTVGVQDINGSIWDTLPLRNGVHPLYRNKGGLPDGGFIKYSVKSIGTSFATGAVLTVVPHFAIVTDGEYEEVAVYYEEETEQGVFLKKWKEQEHTLRLETQEDAEGAVREWYGMFALPEKLYVATPDAEVFTYQEQFGLSFTEEFWRSEEPLMLRFAMRIENALGESLYYGMLPDYIVNNIWRKEAKDSYREDNNGNRYEITGGEAAVVYPGDCGDDEYKTYGIY